MDQHWNILKQLFSKLRGWCGDVYWQSYDFAIDNWKKVITHAMKKVDKSFIETNKPIYNKIIKPILTSPKIEHACNLQ